MNSSGEPGLFTSADGEKAEFYSEDAEDTDLRG